MDSSLNWVVNKYHDQKGVKVNTGGLKVLLFDIETAPNLAYVWGKYEQDVIAFKQERYILSFAYMWLSDEKLHVKGLPDYKMWKKDRTSDYCLAAELHRLFDEADVIVAHNGNKFDIKIVNAALLRHGFKPPSPAKTVDTLLVARNKFGFNSNKLDDIADLLKVGRKVHTGGFELWLGCLAGDKKAWKKMKEYNGHDVVLLEKVYLKLRPWMTNHPNLNLLKMVSCCPTCQSNKVHSRGFGYTKTTKYNRYQCQSCGGWFRGKNEPRELDEVIR
jgi:hypothetical protein